jgi:hypothetical protein
MLREYLLILEYERDRKVDLKRRRWQQGDEVKRRASAVSARQLRGHSC